jgi:alkylation response protein AidB-like acyl-CoA dehydrogenase
MTAPQNSRPHPLAQLSAKEDSILSNLRQLVREKIGPMAAGVGESDEFAWDTFRLLAGAGIFQTAFPTQYGGSDGSMLLRVRLIEEVAGVCSTAASMITGTDLSVRPLVAGGNIELKDQWLPDLVSGKRQAAFGLTEPGAGSDVARLSTHYRVLPDGQFELSGEKKFITRANVADCFMVVARREDGPVGSKGLSAFLVGAKEPGVSVSATVPKMGWYGVPIAGVRFEKVRVPAGALLGQEGEGMKVAQDTLLRARIGHAAIALGRMTGALTVAMQYASRRQVSGRAVSEHQGIQWKVAEMATQIEAARCLVYCTASRYDQADPDIAFHASMAKMHATDLCMQVVVDCLQLLGGNGYLRAFPLERYMRDAKLNQIGEGTSEVHKNMIARHVLRQAALAELHPGFDPDPELFLA